MASIHSTATELEKIAGPLLIAYLLNWGLCGVLSMQVYVYHLAFPNDLAVRKALVYGAYLLDATQTVLFTRSAFRTFASGFGNPAVLDEVDILWFSPILSGMIGFVTQAFYAYRIAVFSQKKFIPGLIILLACFSFAGSIAIGVEVKIAVLFSRVLKKDSLTTAGIWEAGSAACDVLIASSMTYYLKGRDTGIGRTHVLLTRIIRLSIETGSVTAAVAILSLILVLLPGQPTYYQTSVAVLGKVYFNSMMVSLNSRTKTRPCSDTSISACDLPIISSVTPTHLGMNVESGSRSMPGEPTIPHEDDTFPLSSEIPQTGTKELVSDHPAPIPNGPR